MVLFRSVVRRTLTSVRLMIALVTNFLWLYVYITAGTRGHQNDVWFDDVVVATEYIGPLQPKPGER